MRIDSPQPARSGPTSRRVHAPEPASSVLTEHGGLRPRAQVKMLHSLAARLSRGKEPREIGEAITIELRSLIDYHNCRVFMLAPDGETLYPVAFRGQLTEYQGETFDALVTRVGRGITGHVAETGRAYYSPDAAADPHAITIPGTPELDESILGVPLVYGERVIGVVVLSKLGLDQFDEEDMRVLEILASHAAVAIENARLLRLERASAAKARAEIERALDAERNAAQRLREIDDMKNTFLQAVSHDLRTPLSAVMGIALTLDRDDLDVSKEDRKDLMRRLASNARKLDRILSNLLDLDRLVRGVVEPRRRITDVGALVRRVVEEADFLGGNSVAVEAEPLLADVDGAKVERVVENLLINAVRHTPAGTQIWVSVAPEKDSVVISVDDAGPGVPAELRESVFEAFRQGPDIKASPGTGIGLSLVSRFTELHGGHAWVQERPGGGASFRVSLPVRAPTEAA